MMKILLLALAVLVSSNPVQPTPPNHSNRALLRELIDDLDKAVKSFPKDTEGKTPDVFMPRLHGCKPEMFCQAEKELKDTVSGKSGEIFEQFRTDKKLMRSLYVYNKHQGETCKAVDKNREQVHLHAFLKRLMACVKSEYNKRY